MQAGQAGVIVLILAIITSTAGGFIANTTESTACATDFTYVTDVAGAFTGTQGNIEIEHNPTQNISGYSVFNPESTEYKNSTASGISYSPTNPNGYWIQKRTGDPITQTLTISHNRATNNMNSGTVTYNFGSGSSPTSSISGEWGLSNAEIRTVMFVDSTTHVRVAGVSIFDLVQAYKTWKGQDYNTNAIRIYFDNSQDNYPGFITNQAFNMWTAGGTGGYYGINNEVTYTDLVNEIVVNPTNGSVRVNGISYSWTKVYAVWGESNTTQAAITMILGGQVVTEYINPLDGVKPVSMTVNDPTQQGDEANAIHTGGSFTVSANNERTFTATIQYKSGSDSDSYSLFAITIGHFSNGYYYVMVGSSELYSGYQNNDLNVYWDWDNTNPSTVKIWLHSSTMPSNPAVINAGSTPSEGIYQLNVSFNSYGTNIDNITTVLTNKSVTPNTSTSHIGGSSFSYVTTYHLPAEITYLTTYWSNSVENALVSMVIKRPVADVDNTMFARYRLTNDSYVLEPFRMGYKENQWFFYDSTNTADNLGDWPAMMLTIKISNGQHSYNLTPISSFTNFQTYTLVNREYSYESSTESPVSDPRYEALTYILFNNTDELYPYHEIVNTIVLLDDGGLYLNNGWFSPSVSFPTDQIVQFRIMGSPHAGQSVTITTSIAQPYDESFDLDGSQEYVNQNLILGYLPGGEFATDTSIPGITIQTIVVGGTPHLSLSGQATVDGTYYVQAMKYNSPDPDTPYTLQFIVRGAENPALATSVTYDVNSMGNGLIINGKSYLFNEIGLYYVDSSTPTVVIGGEAYAGGLYINGQFLEKGHLYLQAGRNGTFMDLGESNNQWTIQLNGIWAVSTAYYTGENQATSVIVWDEPGKWHWDANLTIICFLAVTIIGLVAMARLYELSIWDWIIPIAACIISFMLLGW